MASSANSLMKEMQKIAANAQIQVQKLANEATEKSFKYNTQEANTARAWQTEMSNTAHQREVKDLIKAGLNPVLAANQGAQSYTTSSASAQANDPSGSIGSLASQLMQSRTGAYQADTSAAATRAAAASSAKATKYAADMNLRAAQAAAYASMYNADKHLEGVKYSTKYNKSGSPFGILDNFINKFVSDKSQKNLFNNSVKEVKGFFGKVDHKKVSGLGYSWFNLDKSGKNFVDNQLRKSGISVNQNMRNLYINAFLKQDKNSFKTWNSVVTASKKRNIYHSGRAWSAGSGVW